MNEADFRAQCAAHKQNHPTLPTLRTLAFVGAYDAEIGGTETDSSRLTTILTYLLKSGVPIDPDFQIDVINFRERRDFMREKNEADLVIVSYILKGKGLDWRRDLFWSDTIIDTKEQCAHLVSRLNNRYEWIERLEQAETKFIITYGGKLEIGTEYFQPDEDDNKLITLIPTPDEECAERYAPPSRFKELYPTCKDLDLPYGWFGIVGERQYLQSIRPAFNSATYLGRKCLELTSPQPSQRMGQEPSP